MKLKYVRQSEHSLHDSPPTVKRESTESNFYPSQLVNHLAGSSIWGNESGVDDDGDRQTRSSETSLSSLVDQYL